MKKFAFAFSLLAGSAFAAEWKGVSSDAKCGAAHADASEKSMKCVNACVGKGQEAVLVSEGKVLKIANQDKVKEHLGHKVTVTGKLDGETITIDNVSMD